jgi:hypothetical protein
MQGEAGPLPPRAGATSKPGAPGIRINQLGIKGQKAGQQTAHLVFNQPKFLLNVAVGLRPSQVVRSTALGVGVLFPELQEYIAPCPRLRTSPRLLLFL